MNIKDIIKKTKDDFTRYIEPYTVCDHLEDAQVITNFEKNIISDDSQQLLEHLLRRNEEQLCVFVNVLRNEETPGEGYVHLYNLIRDDVLKTSNRKHNSGHSEDQPEAKKRRASGYPYDVSEVRQSKTGVDFYNFKLHTEDGYETIVSRGHLLQKQRTVKSIDDKGGVLELKQFNRDKDNVIWLKDQSTLSPIKAKPKYNFERKVYEIGEITGLHWGAIVDLKFVVCEMHPSDYVQTEKMGRIRKQDVLVADNTEYIWLEVWETRTRKINEEGNFFRRNASYKALKCRVAQIHDLKFLQSTSDSDFTKMECYVFPEALTAPQLQKMRENIITEAVRVIATVNVNKIKKFKSCPGCNCKVDCGDSDDSDDESDRCKDDNEFKCTNCSERGSQKYLTTQIIAPVNVSVDGVHHQGEGKLKEFTLYRQQIQKVVEANGADGDVCDLTEEEIAKYLWKSERKWKIRKTPKGNVVSIEEIML